MHIEVDEDGCVGAGQCVLSAPDVFDQREDDGIVVVLDAEPPIAQRANVEEAANRCPASVIRISGN